MRSPVYRNLDKPFQILGFNTIELILLCVVFVGGGELAQLFSISQLWSFIFTFILGLSIYWFRRSLGELFAWRLIRFIKLPDELYPRLFTTRADK